MTEKDQIKAAKEFSEYWKDKGYEKGESQKFWISLLSHVLDVQHAEQYIMFEDKVKLDNTSFIDGYIEETHVLIEQKSLGKDLKQPIKQSDGSLLSPFQQAKRYSAELPYSERPRWIVTCNFEEFNIYDMEKPHAEAEVLFLKDLPKEYYRLQFLVNTESEHIQKEMEISLQAGEIVGALYDELLSQYNDPTNEKSLQSLNMLSVRLVFCLYAEDAGIFGSHGKFHDYMRQYEARDWRRAIIDLFKVLNTKTEERDPYLEPMLASFPYVNGGLFAESDIEIPHFTDHLKELILKNASEDFDWSEISPTIFGAVFESTLNPETRRAGGMHYTSIENIHKVIDPLFLNDLLKDFEEKKLEKVERTRKKELLEFQEKLSKITFFDPACGSGNFLTETYLSLRKIENELLTTVYHGQTYFGMEEIVKIHINQFYGIEINDFAVTVAKTALWIAESQMLKKTEEIMHTELDFLPLKSYANIVEGNALTTDWNTIIPKEKLHYIMGNPPFVGARNMNAEQKNDMNLVFGKVKGLGNLDYVSAWYKKAVEYTFNTTIHCALVSTNSITQGEQVALLWKPLFEKGICFNFAYRTFRWQSETKDSAAVHCVIIGFSYDSKREKILFDGGTFNKVKNINGYLVSGPSVFIENKSSPLCNVSTMDFGSMPNDGGYLSKYTTEEKDAIIAKYPITEKMFKKLLGAEEFINKKDRWCLWLKDTSAQDIKKVPPVLEAIANVKQKRSESTRDITRALAETPTLFAEIRQPETDYLLVPRVSSENRKYVPIGFMNAETIANDATLVIPNATLYEFGVITSNVHMAWMRATCGRLESRYRYSATIVYNNFPWCNPTEDQKKKIEQTAQHILEVRSQCTESSYADLYDDITLTPALNKAHQANDKAVMEAYGFSVKITESSCVAELMKLYETLKG